MRCKNWYCGKRFLSGIDVAEYWFQSRRYGPFVTLEEFLERYCECPE